jgi:hypothetical protein
MGATAEHLEHTAVGDAFDRAVTCAMADEPVYPMGAAFVSADMPRLADAVQLHMDRGQPVVLVYADGRTAMVTPEPSDRLVLWSELWRRSTEVYLPRVRRLVRRAR